MEETYFYPRIGLKGPILMFLFWDLSSTSRRSSNSSTVSTVLARGLKYLLEMFYISQPSTPPIPYSRCHHHPGCRLTRARWGVVARATFGTTSAVIPTNISGCRWRRGHDQDMVGDRCQWLLRLVTKNVNQSIPDQFCRKFINPNVALALRPKR
jgi:hypothetical protein